MLGLAFGGNVSRLEDRPLPMQLPQHNLVDWTVHISADISYRHGRLAQVWPQWWAEVDYGEGIVCLRYLKGLLSDSKKEKRWRKALECAREEVGVGHAVRVALQYDLATLYSPNLVQSMSELQTLGRDLVQDLGNCHGGGGKGDCDFLDLLGRVLPLVTCRILQARACLDAACTLVMLAPHLTLPRDVVIEIIIKVHIFPHWLDWPIEGSDCVSYGSEIWKIHVKEMFFHYY